MNQAILCVFGTRPELIKLAPVIEALRGRGAEVVPLTTGQHADLLDAETLNRVGTVPSLEVPSTTVLQFLTRARRKLHDVLAASTPLPACVVVQGDTMSGFVGAVVARALGIPVAHVEAGVRSGDVHDPWPEELIRVEIDRIATYRYAPTLHAAENLARERLESVVVGNTSVDALGGLRALAVVDPTAPVVVTLHRREFYQRADALAVMQAVFDAAHETRTRVVWPVHPAMVSLAKQLRIPYEVGARPPMSHKLMLDTLVGARGVLTDSGGLVEEAATLGVPTVVLRNHTDRPEAETAGTAVRCAPTVAGVRDAFTILAQGKIPRIPTNVFGDGHAADRIAVHLLQRLI